jgi:hypothetical protein
VSAVIETVGLGKRYRKLWALAAHLNPGWDAEQARDRVGRLDLDPARRPGRCPAGSAPSSR